MIHCEAVRTIDEAVEDGLYKQRPCVLYPPARLVIRRIYTCPAIMRPRWRPRNGHWPGEQIDRRHTTKTGDGDTTHARALPAQEVFRPGPAEVPAALCLMSPAIGGPSPGLHAPHVVKDFHAFRLHRADLTKQRLTR
jgi:hypothetical protein